ncbi:type II toxin-antitoxin system PemK/MazF family toxin [Cellulomonas persica]|uniref:Uncharacterized protein n=1 Tax=Cellulomonas persica TaxID=76861 RepID=A0A510UTV7_9CELL|nr:type II toxin-antitoxin system PemK/MazF family toxin [Cellulomonas persica]GEK17926.1 hypothetical protein CPE01_16590 [Cellulomonas persica]
MPAAVDVPDDRLVERVLASAQEWLATPLDWLGERTDLELALVAAAVVTLLVVVRTLIRRRVRGGPRPGEIWFARVPFDDGPGAKDRPVLVLRRERRRVVVARFTSQDKSGRRDHVRAPAGLPGMLVQGWVDLAPRTLPRGAFRRRVGDAGAATVLWFEQAREKAAPAP